MLNALIAYKKNFKELIFDKQFFSLKYQFLYLEIYIEIITCCIIYKEA